jgi:hypothetical protein
VGGVNMAISYIYEILNESLEPVYIGKADNVESRINAHIASAKRCNSELCKWIRSQDFPLKYRVVARCTSSVVNDVERQYIVTAIKNGRKIFNKMKIKKSKYERVDCEMQDYGVIIQIPFTPEQMTRLNAISNSQSAELRMKSDWFFEEVYNLATKILSNKKESK